MGSSFLPLLLACASRHRVDDVVDTKYVLGELLENGADCIVAGPLPVCVFRVPPGTVVLAPFDGLLVLHRAPVSDRVGLASSPYAPMFETVFFARGAEPRPTLYIGPLEVSQEQRTEVPYVRGDMVGTATTDELFVSLWYSDGDCRRELFREHPAGWPTVLPHGPESGVVRPCYAGNEPGLESSK